MGYNEKQKDVIDYDFKKENKNLLVSAAAGSGKTKVLIDKIYNMVAEGTSLNKMLIMTFTIKATHEMKSRLKERFEKEIKKWDSGKVESDESKKERIIKEASTIQNANITTIDAFCKKILEENYLELNKEWSLYKNFDPSYKIADEKELSILYDTVLDDFLEKEVYNNKNKYDHFLKSFFKKNSDKEIKVMFIDGLKFLSSLAWPMDKIDEWINDKDNVKDKAKEKFKKEEIDSITESINEIKSDAEYEKNIEELKKVITNAKNKCKSPKDKSVIDKLNNCLKAIETIKYIYNKIKNNNINEKFLKDTFFKNDIFLDEKEFNTEEYKFPPKKDIEDFLDENGKKAYIPAQRKFVSIYKMLEKRLEVINNLKTIDDALNSGDNENEKIYMELLKDFYLRVVEEKVHRNIYAISDYASMALDILYDNDKNGEKVVSKFAEENCKTKYDYIFVDEYQDTNNIQEKLINAVSNGKNVFMVGDVKQSIYAFRNSDPSIFTNKFDDYVDYGSANTSNSGNGGNLIKMDINYRSKYPILKYVNELFGNIMTKEFGDIEYQTEGKLDLPTKENTDLTDEELKAKEGEPVEIYLVYDEALDKAESEDDTKKSGKKKKDDKKEEEKKNKENSSKDDNGDNDSSAEKSACAVSEKSTVSKKTVKNSAKEIANNNESAKTTDNTSSAESSEEDEEVEKIKGLELEAEFIAKKIENLVKGGYDYKDIVILLRNAKNKSEIIMEALARHNIPSFSDIKKGFFNRAEIKLMVDVLNIIDNPRQDIPLANVLTSNIVGLSNNDLAIIKYLHLKTTNYNKTSLCDDVNYANNYLKYLGVKDIEKVLEEETEKKKNSIQNEADKKIESLKKDKDFDKEKYQKSVDKEKEDLDKKLPTTKEEVKEFVKLCKGYDKEQLKKIHGKLDSFTKLFDEFRFKSRYLGIGDLINLIYDKTRIKSAMLAMNDGIMRNANLDVLYETAKSYESSSFVGLFNFMRYIERIKELDDDQGLAKINDENDNVVRIMTIHTSKGLEFKCVILANTTARYYSDPYSTKVPIQFDSKLGIAMDYYNLDEGYKIETLKKKLIATTKKNENRKEEMRVLYVAMTRAKEKLIIVGNLPQRGSKVLTYKKANDYYGKIKRVKDKKGNDKYEKIVFESPKDCDSYMQLILTNYNDSSDFNILEKCPISFSKKDMRQEDALTIDMILKDEEKDKELKAKIENENKAKSSAEEKDILDLGIFDILDKKKLKESITNDYQFDDYKKIKKTKMSVSDIKKEKHDTEEAFQMINHSKAINTDYYSDTGVHDNKRAKNEKNDGTEIGNAYHRYMQFYNYDDNKYDGEIGNTGDDWIKKVDEFKIDKFKKSDVGKEMAKAYHSGNLYREQKFMKLFNLDQINQYGNIYDKDELIIKEELSKENNIIIQGIVDAFYIEKDSEGEYIVLVDYKTDGISKSKVDEKKLRDQLVSDYYIQLKIYADALKDLTGLEVKKKYIYSFALDKEIELVDEEIKSMLEANKKEREAKKKEIEKKKKEKKEEK